MSESRPPVRSRSGRRPIIPMVFLLVLALAALGVWWNVFRAAENADRAQAAACTSAAQPPTSLDPTTVQLRVLNATDTAGLAQTVAATLQSRGFVVTEVSNDPSGREVTGTGELRHGPRGNSAASFMALYLPGAGDLVDTRADATVDVVIGPDFTDLTPEDQVAAALTPAAATSPGC